MARTDSVKKKMRRLINCLAIGRIVKRAEKFAGFYDGSSKKTGDQIY